MNMREIDGFEVWASVEQAGTDGPLVAVIMVKCGDRNILRRHELQGFHYASAKAAEDFALTQLDGVVGVSSDGSLKFH